MPLFGRDDISVVDESHVSRGDLEFTLFEKVPQT